MNSYRIPLRRAAHLALITLIATFLAGCLDSRTTGTVLDDQTMEYRVIDAIYDTDEIGEESHIKVEVYESVVLLMGETPSDAQRSLAEQRAAAVPHVERVVNEIQVTEIADFGTKLNNTWLTTKINTALVTENPLEGFDATRIKVVSSDHTVYLMGLVTREEGQAVTEIARNVRGVEKVVKVFDYTN